MYTILHIHVTTLNGVGRYYHQLKLLQYLRICEGDANLNRQ
jgi:hypothetical protein